MFFVLIPAIKYFNWPMSSLLLESMQMTLYLETVGHRNSHSQPGRPRRSLAAV